MWTDDGGLPYYKLPRSLRLRGAKNVKVLPTEVLSFKQSLRNFKTEFTDSQGFIFVKFTEDGSLF